VSSLGKAGGRLVAQRFDLVILDLDGTLVDSEALLVTLVNATLTAADCQPAPPRAVASAIGLPLADVFRRAAPDAEPDVIDTLCANYRRRADAADFVRQFTLYADVAETLAALYGSSVRLAIGTSKGRATTLDILAHCGIARYIDAVIGGDCVERGKPHPEMIERARALCAAAPQRTLMVGDTSFDIRMGQAAGVATCAVTYGMHEADSLRRLRPDFVIDRFCALFQLVVESRADPLLAGRPSGAIPPDATRHPAVKSRDNCGERD
jgi:phosphoglycolate phosphatase